MQKRLFPELGIAPALLQAIEAQGFELPSPIQSEAIPVALEGKDVVGQSQTGSGKTLAFGVPVLQKIDPAVGEVQALILCPTRELAMQVCSELHKLDRFLDNVRAVPVYGGASYDRQIRAIKQGAQIVVGTPGRVLDLARRGDLRFSKLKHLVFDEADEMLNLGFRDDIDTLMNQVPEDRQTIFFSATLSRPIRDLIEKITRDPVTITIEHKALTVPSVEQRYYEARGRSKLEVLCRVLDIEGVRRGIVFANTKKAVDEITDSLVGRGYTADRLHGDLSQMMRDRVMRNFRSGTVDMLIATDVAARGLDVDDVEIIFNYDLPYDEEDYVHRIGRTGRAGRSGKAVSLVGGREIFLLQRIQRYIKTSIKRESIPSQEAVTSSRVDKFFETVRQTLDSGEFKNHDDLVQRLLDAGHTPTDIASALLDTLLKVSGRPAESIAEDSAPPPGRNRESRPFDKRERGGGEGREFEERRPRRQRPERPTAGGERLFINVGRMDKVRPGDIAGAIYNTTGIPQGSLGSIEIFDKCSYVTVPGQLVDPVIEKIRGTKIKGRPVRMDRADRPAFDKPTKAPKYGAHKRKPRQDDKPFFNRFKKARRKDYD